MNADITPAIVSCFFCGGSKRRLALIKGKMDGGSFPRVCVDHEPCPDCQEQMQGKIVVFEVGPEDITRRYPQVVEGVFLTGRWVTLTVEGVLASSMTPEVIDKIVEARVAFVERQYFERWLPEDQRAEKPEDSSAEEVKP